MKSRAFTLIELLVVVLIIGILSAIALPQYRMAVVKARFTQAMIAGNALLEAQKIYHMANGVYATTNEMDELDVSMPSGAWGGCALLSTGEIDCVTTDGLTFAAFPQLQDLRYCRWYRNDSNAPETLKEKVCLNVTGAIASSKAVSESGFSQYRF